MNSSTLLDILLGGMCNIPYDVTIEHTGQGDTKRDKIVLQEITQSPEESFDVYWKKLNDNYYGYQI
jgi:hypothetical protein